MAGNGRQVFGTAVRWTIGWTTLGFLLGVLLMLSKAPPIAESGRKPSDMAFYSFWVPVTSIAGAVVGFCLGTAFAVLMIVGERWRAPIEAPARMMTAPAPSTSEAQASASPLGVQVTVRTAGCSSFPLPLVRTTTSWPPAARS